MAAPQADIDAARLYDIKANTVVLTQTEFDALEHPPDSGLYPSLIGKNVIISNADVPGAKPELVFDTLALFPVPGDSTKLYIDINTNQPFRWDSAISEYVPLARDSRLATKEWVTDNFTNTYIKGNVTYRLGDGFDTLMDALEFIQANDTLYKNAGVTIDVNGTAPSPLDSSYTFTVPFGVVSIRITDSQGGVNRLFDSSGTAPLAFAGHHNCNLELSLFHYKQMNIKNFNRVFIGGGYGDNLFPNTGTTYITDCSHVSLSDGLAFAATSSVRLRVINCSDVVLDDITFDAAAYAAFTAYGCTVYDFDQRFIDPSLWSFGVTMLISDTGAGMWDGNGVFRSFTGA